MMQVLNYIKYHTGLSKYLESVMLGVMATPRYDIKDICPKVNLTPKQLKEVLSHARIEIEEDKYINEDGLRILTDREVGKVKRYFEQSIANYASLSEKEKRTFDEFVKRYGIKYRTIKKWDDLKVEAIRNDCYDEIRSENTLIFFDGKFICKEDFVIRIETKAKSVIQLIRRSLMYNLRKMRKWIRFKPISDSTVAYILTHHFHIFTSDESNSIHKAEKILLSNLPQDANRYILAA